LSDSAGGAAADARARRGDDARGGGALGAGGAPAAGPAGSGGRAQDEGVKVERGRLQRWLVWGTVGIAAALAFALALREPPLEVDVATVARRPLVVTLDEEGETRAREPHVISAPVAGRVERIELEPGDRVVAGETVVARFMA